MNARGGNFLDRQNGLGYSSASKNNYGGYIGSAYTNRSILIIYLDIQSP